MVPAVSKGGVVCAKLQLPTAVEKAVAAPGEVAADPVTASDAGSDNGYALLTMMSPAVASVLSEPSASTTAPPPTALSASRAPYVRLTLTMLSVSGGRRRVGFSTEPGATDHVHSA